jgi:hypothetical protein
MTVFRPHTPRIHTDEQRWPRPRHARSKPLRRRIVTPFSLNHTVIIPHTHFCRVCARVCDFTTPFLLPSPSLQDTVTGFLLAGVGQKDAKGLNFLVVDASA